MLYAEGEYERTFQLIDANEVLEETTAFVTENGYELILNYEIAPGENYGLRCILKNHIYGERVQILN